MLKRFKPNESTDGTTTFSLPDDYVGGGISVFVNGVIYNTRDEDSHPFGYTLDEDDKTFTFYIALQADDTIYVLYDSDGSSDDASDYSGTGLMRLQPGYNLVSYQGLHQAHWDKDNHEVDYDQNILACVQNLIIDQIDDIYGSAEAIIREIQTFETDTGKYRTFKLGTTSPAWCGDAEHITNSDLYREEEEYEYGDPDDNNYVVYNPNNFSLSNCTMDADFNLISLDTDNSIEDLPSGLRTGIIVYIYEDADLSSTDDRLEIWF